MRETHVKLLAAISFVGVLVFALYYPYKFFYEMWSLNFVGPKGWQVFYFVEDDVEVPFWARLGHFTMWLPSFIATQTSLLAALYLIWRVYRQIYFEMQTITALQIAGIGAAVGAACNLIAGSFDGWLLTRFNSDENFPISFRLESGEMGVLLTGIGLFLLAWVTRLALLKRVENSEMI